MKWDIIDYTENIVYDFADISIVTSSIECVENKEYRTYEDFIDFLKNSYNIKGSLTRQIKVDFPRLECYIDNTRIYTLHELIAKIKYIHYKKELFMICTQTSLFPITYICYQKYTQFDKNIHLSDKKTFPIKIFIDLQNNTIYIYKTFRIIQFDQYGKEHEIETITTCSFLCKKSNILLFTISNNGNV